MFRPRVIPLLLLRNLGLVKSIRFKDYRYIGDPINAVKLFNDLKADELAFVDIMATRENRTIPLSFVKNVGDEANMPFSVGGGIRTISEIKAILNAGAEKVIINASAVRNPDFIREAAEEFGSSTVVVSIDVKKNIWGKSTIYQHSLKKNLNIDPVEFAITMENKGAGEIILNSVDRDGTMSGYDLELIKTVSQAVRIPIVALGGAGKPEDLRIAVKDGYASAAAAGSLFIYHGPRNAVLVNYPTREELNHLFEN